MSLTRLTMLDKINKSKTRFSRCIIIFVKVRWATPVLVTIVRNIARNLTAYDVSRPEFSLSLFSVSNTLNLAAYSTCYNVFDVLQRDHYRTTRNTLYPANIFFFFLPNCTNVSLFTNTKLMVSRDQPRRSTSTDFNWLHFDQLRLSFQQQPPRSSRHSSMLVRFRHWSVLIAAPKRRLPSIRITDKKQRIFLLLIQPRIRGLLTRHDGKL